VSNPEKQIANAVNHESQAYDEQDIDALVGVHHPDMVSLWPPTPHSHDPMEWVMGLGRFDRQRWADSWRKLFATHSLIHNKRTILRIEVSEQQDAAFAVVDVDTLWRSHEGADFHWKGRACKVYTKVDDRWLLIMQTGLLLYFAGA
jgi:ketosteroid isomerase-like protein